MNPRSYPHAIDAPVLPPPRTVVSLVPSVTESLFELGLGSRVMAVTEYCVYPADGIAHLPKVGGTKNPDVARIIALQPELVIANQEENRPEDVEALRAAGLPVWVTFPKTVRDAMNLLWAMMQVFDYQVMLPRISLIERTLDWLEGVAETRVNSAAPCRVFVPIWYDPLMTFNADTYTHDLLRVCGGSNIFATRERRYPLEADLGQAEPYAPDDPRVIGRDTRYPRITLDEASAAQPDVILLPSEPFHFTAEHLPIFTALDVPAAKHGRIHLVDGALLTWHGTRIARAFDTLPALLWLPEGSDEAKF